MKRKYFIRKKEEMRRKYFLLFYFYSFRGNIETTYRLSQTEETNDKNILPKDATQEMALTWLKLGTSVL